MKRFAQVVLSLVVAAGVAHAGDAFDRLKALEGTWTGMAHGQPAEVVYKVTSAGSAVVETLFPGSEHEMVSVYHRDGDDVVMTHYCAAQNQPRMRAKNPGDAASLVFAFDGGTNIDAKTSMHMHDAKFEFNGPDELHAEWTSWNEGKPAETVVFEMKRKR